LAAEREPNSFTTWDALSKAFLNKYFPPGKTAKLRTEITSFVQRDGESLYEVWERYKDLQRQCPHHVVPDWLLIQTFYNGLEQSVKISVDAAAGGALMRKSIDAAKALLEEMASNNYHWIGDRATPQRGSGKYSVDAVTLLARRVDALAQRLEKVTSSPSPVRSSGSAVEVYAICETCGVQGHTSTECYNGPHAIAHVNAYQGYHSLFPTSLPTTKGERVTPTPHLQTPSHLLKILCAHQASNFEPPTPLHLHLNHLQPT